MGAFKIEAYAYDCFYLGAKNYAMKVLGYDGKIWINAKMKGISKEARDYDKISGIYNNYIA